MGLSIVTADGNGNDKGTIIYKKIKTNTNGQNYPAYSTTISSKDKDGNWKQAYIAVRFYGNADVPNKSIIAINKSFLTFNPNVTNGEKYPYIMIMDFEMLKEGEDGLRNAIESMDDEMPFM